LIKILLLRREGVPTLRWRGGWINLKYSKDLQITTTPSAEAAATPPFLRMGAFNSTFYLNLNVIKGKEKPNRPRGVSVSAV
jgi:hypothetical protein